MLTVYIPEETSDAAEECYLKAVRICRSDSTLIVCRVGSGFAVKTAWCREVVVGTLKDIFTEAPPGVVNIYGIRKHGSYVQHQPPHCPGKLSQTSLGIDNLFTNLFQLVVELVSGVLDDESMSPERLRSWIYRWTMQGFQKSY